MCVFPLGKLFIFTPQYLKSTIAQYIFHLIEIHRFPIVKVRYLKIRREVDLDKNLVLQTRKEKAQKGSQNETILRRRTGSGR